MMAVASKSQFEAGNLPEDFPKKTGRLTLTPAIGDFADVQSADPAQLSARYSHLSPEHRLSVIDQIATVS